jgi:circadian clock protein KaiC
VNHVAGATNSVSTFSTGVPNLDALLGGGLPANTLNILAGEPGTGKTILAQQALFHYVKEHPDSRVLYITTLSEPAMKVIRYLQNFSFYDPDAFGMRVVYRDVGGFLREHPTKDLLEEIVRLVEEYNPAILCIDSFKAIRDLMPNPEEFRRFCYDLSVRLSSAACTTLLLGEYEDVDTADGAEFAVADGIVAMRRGELNGEPQRMLRVKKMRGQPMNMGEFPFAITSAGVHVFTPGLMIAELPDVGEIDEARVPTGISGLDDLLHGGLMRGRSVMLSGVSGSGKTTLALQFLLEGAKRGERGLLYSFEETEERLLLLADRFGWDLRPHVAKGLIKIVSRPLTEIRVDENLESMTQEIVAWQPQRLVMDSFSVFLHKIDDPAMQRDVAFQIARLVSKTGVIALLTSDIPSHETNRVSRFGVEETVVDGTIVLSTELRGPKRVRYIEVYKMRAVEHVRGRHRMDIGAGGIRVFYRAPEHKDGSRATSLTYSPMEGIVDGEVPYDHSWLIRGGPGAGKSVWAIQYAVERLRSGEAVLFVATEASARTILSSMERLGLLTEPYLEAGQLVVKSAEDDPELDIDDPESFINMISIWLDAMPKPCARILDSLTPLMVGMSPEEFKSMLTKRRQYATRSDISMMDTVMASTDLLQPYLTNHFDVVVDLYTPDWGDLRGADDRGRPVMRVVKARGVRVDTRPYPFRISKEGGVVVQKDFYGSRS